MPRSPSSLLFALTLGLSLALLVWWTWFLVDASDALAAAGERLAAGDVPAAARALGADDAAGLAALASSRRTMFLSEGAVFAAILLLSGWLYTAARRGETELRLQQDRFLAGATHELKTPLATIVLLLESLRAGRVPEAKRDRYLADGLREAERLERGLTNVLSAAGLRTTARLGQPQPGDLAADVREAAAALQARAAAADVALRLALPAALPCARDPAAIQLVLRNLLDNAIKFSPAGAAVEVSLQEQAGAAVVRVRDHGRGLDAEELRHAFQPFWRTDHAAGGTGLGLHLVRELVRAHGGTVAAHSDGRGRGAEFAVTLPRRGRDA